jgi:predicted Fe-Mo cluster-binding NifX family protein
LQSTLEKVESEKSEQQAAEDGCHRIAEAMKYIEKFLEKQPESEKEIAIAATAATAAGLQKAQLLLESSVETVLISKLGSLKFPMAKRLGELWKFPSDHPPIAAVLTLGKHSIKVASWNVLNRNYYKYIEQDTQGLKGSEISTYHEAGTRENKIIEKIQEMLQKDFHILCLQECWPELLEQLKGALAHHGHHGHHEMECSGQEQDKNQEASH